MIIATVTVTNFNTIQPERITFEATPGFLDISNWELTVNSDGEPRLVLTLPMRSVEFRATMDTLSEDDF